MKVIFLEFDGVLNSDCYYLKRTRNMRELRLFEIYPKTEYERLVQWHLYELDLYNIDILKEIVDETNSYVVVVSRWSRLKCFDGICNELKKLGIPIIDKIEMEIPEVGKNYNVNNTSNVIKKYISDNNVDSFVIIDSHDYYDQDLLNHLVKTNQYDSGLTETEKEIAINKLKDKSLRLGVK